MSRMQDKYTKEVAPALMEKFGYKSVMQIPKLNKIVINIGMGEAKDNPRLSKPQQTTSQRSQVRSR